MPYIARMTFVFKYKLMAFIFQTNIIVARMESQIMGKCRQCPFLCFLHLIGLESSYKQYNKLYQSLKYHPNRPMLFLYIISYHVKWLDCGL